ncbi:MAG: GrpB family protein [Actinomycetota bacterium]|nr:GrpB family protein [Actinomycetota bacterium]
MTGLGYEYVAEFKEPLPSWRFFLKKSEGLRTRHVHLVERSSVELRDRHMSFRDDRNAYTNAKTDFIIVLEQQAKNAS